MKERLTKLLCIKSLVTLTLTAVFAALALSLVLYLIIYVAARRIVDRRQPTATA